jgi:Asp-tRNA(Asn)/Glu-tRNA(Gln) amidotransferase A subunit family amidase
MNAAGLGSAERAAAQCIAAIERHEAKIKAWTEHDTKAALQGARSADRSARPDLLAGRLIGIKDIIDVAGFHTGCGSSIYKDRMATHDAAAVSLIKDAGGIVLGKTETTEFAYFSPSGTRNPYNPEHTPGGSSSGSAAAVATGMVPIALGTQTAASITRPASYCGIVGFKPTFGAYSLVGVKTLAHSLDTLGILARSVSDVALMHAVLSRGSPPVLRRNKPRIGYCQTPAWRFASDDTIDAMITAREALERAGAEVRGIVLPEQYDDLDQIQSNIMAYDAARDLSYEDLNHRSQLSEHICALIDSGIATPVEVYRQSHARAAAARSIADDLFQTVDVIMAPAATGEAPHGLHATGNAIFSRMWTLLHLPTICLPGFEGKGKLPIGMQFLGPLYGDQKLFDHASWIETVFDALSPGFRHVK